MVLSFCTRIKQLAEMINNILIFWPGLGCRNVEVLWPPGSLRILSQPLVLGGQPAIPSFWESCLFITCTLRVRAPLFQISPPFCTLLLDLSSAVCVCCAPVAGWTAGPSQESRAPVALGADRHRFTAPGSVTTSALSPSHLGLLSLNCLAL